MRIANPDRAMLIRGDGIVDIARASGGSLPDDPQAVSTIDGIGTMHTHPIQRTHRDR